MCAKIFKRSKEKGPFFSHSVVCNVNCVMCICALCAVCLLLQGDDMRGGGRDYGGRGGGGGGRPSGPRGVC